MSYDLAVQDLAPYDPTVHSTEKKLRIFYDETNNIRKLLLTEVGLNVKKYDNFVLGGVVVDEGTDIGDLKELRDVLKIQTSAQEIKFDLVAQGDFEKVLDSKKLGDFFKWLNKYDIKIHYSNLNILNWSILDIVESIVADDSLGHYRPVHLELKNELYRMVTHDVPGFLDMLHNFKYPNVNRSDTAEFVKAVRGFVLKHMPIERSEALSLLSQILLEAQNLTELPFIVDETQGELIGGFNHFFLNRVARFPKAKHIFDEEPTIQKSLSGIRVLDGTEAVDFSFADSKDVPGIQLSDVVVGFLGKYFTFIERTTPKVLVVKRNALSSTQKENLKLFRRLVEKTDEFSNALLFRMTTMDSNWKADYFLFGKKLPAHLTDR